MFAKAAVALLGALVCWSVVAWPSGAHGDKATYRVRPYDTLWTIAASRYGGDVRDDVWRIERANHLGSPKIRPGQLLVLP
jgi:nucleoid-associated protein YgaU